MDHAARFPIHQEANVRTCRRLCIGFLRKHCCLHISLLRPTSICSRIRAGISDIMLPVGRLGCARLNGCSLTFFARLLACGTYQVASSGETSSRSSQRDLVPVDRRSPSRCVVENHSVQGFVAPPVILFALEEQDAEVRGIAVKHAFPSQFARLYARRWTHPSRIVEPCRVSRHQNALGLLDQRSPPKRALQVAGRSEHRANDSESDTNRRGGSARLLWALSGA